jgi:hypothetical protein
MLALFRQSLKMSVIQANWKLRIILGVLVSLAAISLPAQDIVKMQYLPHRMIGGKYYDITPIYSWIDETANILKQRQQGARLNFTNPDEFLANGWCGVQAPIEGYLPIYQVFSIMDGGLLVQQRTKNGFTGEYELGDPFFLTNYPGFKNLTDNQKIQFLALRTGSYQYTATDGSVRTIPYYD